MRFGSGQGDGGERVSVILNAVKNPEPPTTQRSGLPTYDSPIPRTDCVSRLSDVNVVGVQWLGILRRFTPQNDRRRAPSCHSERSEESRTSAGAYTSSLDSRSVAGMTAGPRRGGSRTAPTSRWATDFGCEMAAAEHCLGLFVAVLLRMTAVPVPN